jgi:hypothetical protein
VEYGPGGRFILEEFPVSIHPERRCLMFWRTLILFLALGLNSSLAQAGPIFYADRASFLGAVGPSITDDYSAYTSTPESPVVLTNAAMSAVLGETSYESLSFQDLNLVGDVYVHGDGTNYCAGCNGNFRLTFDNTSLAVGGGVFGVAVDIVLHTARSAAIGDVIPGDRVADGTVLVEFTDGTVDQVTVPADIGFFGPETFFLGLTDDRGIKSLTVGIEPIPQRHRWVIDNLTIAASVTESVPLDIKPQACPNRLNVNSKGVLPVAILGTDTFDVVQVDPDSVMLAGVEPLRWVLEDVATPKTDDCTTDGPDGITDLSLKFDTQEIVGALPSVNDGDVVTLELGGNLKAVFSGTPIEGEDVVIILKKGR